MTDVATEPELEGVTDPSSFPRALHPHRIPWHTKASEQSAEVTAEEAADDAPPGEQTATVFVVKLALQLGDAWEAAQLAAKLLESSPATAAELAPYAAAAARAVLADCHRDVLPKAVYDVRDLPSVVVHEAAPGLAAAVHRRRSVAFSLFVRIADALEDAREEGAALDADCLSLAVEGDCLRYASEVSVPSSTPMLRERAAAAYVAALDKLRNDAKSWDGERVEATEDQEAFRAMLELATAAGLRAALGLCALRAVEGRAAPPPVDSPAAATDAAEDGEAQEGAADGAADADAADEAAAPKSAEGAEGADGEATEEADPWAYASTVAASALELASAADSLISDALSGVASVLREEKSADDDEPAPLWPPSVRDREDWSAYLHARHAPVEPVVASATPEKDVAAPDAG